MRHPQNHLNWCKICIKFIPFNRIITVSDFTKWLVLLKNVECWSIILNNIEQGVKEEISINFIFSFIETVSWKSTGFGFFLRMDARPRREITWPSKEGAYYLRATKSITRWPFLPPSASVLTIEIDQNAWENTDNKNEISASQDMSSYAVLFENDTQKTLAVTIRIFFF